MSETVHLSNDFFRHDPVSVQLISENFEEFAKHRMMSRYIRRNGAILEVGSDPDRSLEFLKGQSGKFRIFLPHETTGIEVEGTINKVLHQAWSNKGEVLSLLGVRFHRLDIAAGQKLETHDLLVQSEIGKDRSERYTSSFQLELLGIDVMYKLMVKDLSMSGVFVGGKAKFPVGKVLSMRFRLPFQKTEVSTTGVVIWAGEKNVTAENKEGGFGVQFIDIPPSTRYALATYCARNSLTT